jgi:hypothetical protein
MWDERAPVHAASGYYDVPGFPAGQDSNAAVTACGACLRGGF